ncbi:uncharacterized protein BJX67DRAFT_20775 [Aspergillus lucknowensis]|uniref:Lysine-specific metallo-endopeptidase domain-containing protein n=1 Tax=Aspergillus lucknowensis TaxID=176173 RepID=A0ABR4M8A7_9EURO
MAKHSFLLALITAYLVLLPCTVAVDITDIFTVQPGSSDGGCDDRAAVLDQWLSEGIESLDVALNAIDEYNQDIRVRRSMSVIFGISNSGPLRPNTARAVAVGRVRDYIEHIGNFYNNLQQNGRPLYDRAGFWLFCHSTFLSLHEPTSPALDYLGNEIGDENDNPISISDVPTYQEQLNVDRANQPWWSGELTDLNGYYFTEYGGNYCYEDDLGITAAIQPFTQGANGQAVAAHEIASVILCPYSFDETPRPNSYRDANNLLARGRNLADAIPKSTTLIHEAFHAIHGTAFLAGADERYDIASCLNLANSAASSAQANPENYVFFIAHMYHMRGDADGNEPWSIPTHWDFELMGAGQNRVYGAIQTT